MRKRSRISDYPRRVTIGTALVKMAAPFEARVSTLFILLVLSLSMLAFVEIIMAFPLTTGMMIIYALACLLLFLPFFLFNRTKWNWVMAALFAVGMVIIHVTPWTPRKPFLRDLNSLNIGMTTAEIRETMSNWILESPWPTEVRTNANATTSPPITVNAAGQGQRADQPPPPFQGPPSLDTMIYRHSLEGRFSEDRALLTLKKQRLDKVEFLPE